MIDAQKIITELEEKQHKHIKFALTDINGILRSKVISLSKFKEIINSGIGFCEVVFGWDSQDRPYLNSPIEGSKTGYADRRAKIDLSTLRYLPTHDNIPFFLSDMNTDEHLRNYCSRGLLKRIISQGKAMGFQTKSAQEFEWVNFQQIPLAAEKIEKNLLQPISGGMHGYSHLRPIQRKEFFQSIMTTLEETNIPLEGLHTETGPGVYEAAISYDHTLQAADKAVLFKSTIKELANQHGISASFMAKWNENLPGCGGHIHQSLWNINADSNLFSGTFDEQKNGFLGQYVAGILRCMPDLMPIYAPTVNSYKRLHGGDWAPNSVSWGIDNRTVALRILPHAGKSARIELRVPGADTNPYLVMAAMLASGLYGVSKSLKLTKPTTGNAYTSVPLEKRLPANLREATGIMRNSSLANRLLGKEFVDYYCRTRGHEYRQYERTVSDWEINRYFELS